MIVLDTTVLVYAVGTDHLLREPARRVVSAIGAGDLTATTTVEVIQEFAHVRARRCGREDAESTAAAFAGLLGPLLRPGDQEVRHGLRLFGASSTLGAFDSVLAATVLRADHLSTLVSADRAFTSVPQLRHVDLADAEAITHLLSA